MEGKSKYIHTINPEARPICNCSSCNNCSKHKDAIDTVKSLVSLYPLTEEEWAAINNLTSGPDIRQILNNIRHDVKRKSGNGFRDIDGDWVPPMIETKDVLDIIDKYLVNTCLYKG